MDLSGPCLIDSNLLVYFLQSEAPKTGKAREIFKNIFQNRIEAHVTHQNILETTSVLTKRYHQDIEEVHEKLEALINEFQFRIILPKPQTYKTFKNLLKSGDQKHLFDIYLAATALDNGVNTILTENTKDFEGIEEITAINPFI